MFNPVQLGSNQYSDIYVCVSTDTKDESDKHNGDILLEMDTGKIYLFNAAGTVGSKWTEWGAA